MFLLKGEWGDAVQESRIVQPASLSLNQKTKQQQQQLLAVYGNSYLKETIYNHHIFCLFLLQYIWKKLDQKQSQPHQRQVHF